VRPGLAESLRLATQPLHAEVERAGVMAALIRGQCDLATYCALLRNLHALYAALESALAGHAGDPGIARVYFPELWRQSAIAADLRALHGERWALDLELVPSADRYVEHLRRIEQEQPIRLVAHAYIRYLGDLSGGQILRRVLANVLQRDDGSGMQFYAYPQIRDTATFAERYRAGLDSIELDEQTAACVIAEARLGFQLHAAMFRELATAPAHPAGVDQLTPVQPRPV
jgi:heme oxygenase